MNKVSDKPKPSDDKEQYAISRCSGCPECDGNNIDRHEAEETPDAIYTDAWCLDCGASWLEVSFATDEDDDGVSV